MEKSVAEYKMRLLSTVLLTDAAAIFLHSHLHNVISASHQQCSHDFSSVARFHLHSIS
ncbi:hypothetical protein TELCIR_02051 [Teladorsagia circumcincta]|uniref:Uncharacterized protein n=1 Tax=Teladorsagia circumcincta TaxID=45464 RepID=A0A2G9V075_TELCI|nr:hypothetical protein TELCIR_02051 [Teladorsagia circumcincta]